MQRLDLSPATTSVQGLDSKPTELIPIPPGRSVAGVDGGKSFDVLILEVHPPRSMVSVRRVLWGVWHACSALSLPLWSVSVHRQSGTQKRPSREALLARGMSGTNFLTAYRVRGVVCMTRQQTFHRKCDGQWPTALESMIRTEWPDACVHKGLLYLSQLGRTVHVYTNSNPRRAPPGLYLASRKGTIAWSQYYGAHFMLLQEWEVESSAQPRA